MQARFSTYSIEHHSDSIICPKCGKPGKVVWDDISRLGAQAEPELLGIEGPFFERLGRNPPYPIEVVCRECGSVAVTAYPSTSLHDKAEYN